MASINSAFSIIEGALNASQEALSIVSNNVANANTPGYTQEIPQWETADTVQIGNTSYGDGVVMEGPVSQRNPVLENSLDQQTQDETDSAARLSALDQLQSIFSSSISTSSSSTSSTTGISQDLSSFFSAWSALASSPSSNSQRQAVIAAAQTLASDFNSASSQLMQLGSSLDQQTQGITQQVNGLTTQIANLNAQIGSQSPNQDAGTLEDERETAIAKLSSLVGITQIKSNNNQVMITTTSGALLVSGNENFALSSGKVNGVTNFFDSQGTDITSGLTGAGGQLGGLLTARDQDVPQVESALDAMAYQFGTAVNTQNEAGNDANGNAGTAIFSLPSSATGAAAGISVAITDPSKLAAAAAGDGSQNGSNASAIAGFANQNIVNGTTPTGYYSSFVTSIGTVVSNVQSSNSVQQASITQLNNQIGAISGVNLNNEAASLETLEQSYQAASKAFTVLTNVMTAALNLGVDTSFS